MDDHLTISFGGDDQSQASAESGTHFRQREDTKSLTSSPPHKREAVSGFGDDHRYQLVRKIARGGMGVVYEGWDSQLCRSVAIKIMDESQQRQPAGLDRFLREARIASQLQHPGIVSIHEFGATLDGQVFIVMDLLLGQTLRHELRNIVDRDRELPRLLTYFSDVCQAVASAHESGVIHRDIKPSNIMICRHGVVSVMDWGVAKFLRETTPASSSGSTKADPAPPPGHPSPTRDPDQTAAIPDRGHTVSGTIVGTPSYLPPEQARGDVDHVDFRSDVFGLGSVLCEILTGHAPFDAESVEDRCRQAAAGDLRDAIERLDHSNAPIPLVTLAKRCLAASPSKRPANAGEVAAAVTYYLESGQRRAEQELVRFFDLSLDLFCIAKLDGTFHRLNNNLKPMLGYEPHDLEGQPFLNYVHPDDRERTRHELSTLADQIPTRHFRNRYRHADGHYVWLEWNARAVTEESAVYAVARNVSDLMTEAEISAFTAVAGILLTASGSLTERLIDVVSEGASQLDLLAMEVWHYAAEGSAVERIAASSPKMQGVAPNVIESIISRQQPQQFCQTDTHRTITLPKDATCFVGYPLMLGFQPLGLLGVYTRESLSSKHLIAMNTLVTSLTLAIAADH